MTGPDPATLAQIRAADPAGSTWLSANAGSGKTRVLTDRVARLLLDLVPPQNILCLTFTKAAAGEMQNRLFARLGGWSMLPDADLEAELDRLGYAGERDLQRARTLFARAIETPGGLKIQTIHSFCAAVLRQFPLEAGVTPGFRELDERTQGHLIEAALDRVAEGDPERAVSRLAALAPTVDIAALAAEIVRRREYFADAPEEAGLRRACGAPSEAGWLALCDAARLDAGVAGRLLTALAGGSPNDQKAAAAFQDIALDAPDPVRDLPVLEKLLLYGPKAKAGPFSAKIGAFPTKDTQKALGPDMDAIEAFMGAVEAARPARLARHLFDRTRALHAFAAPLLAEYAEEKRARGMVDFDDLIHLTRRLLAERTTSDWVRFKLDGRIDHVLVDEAQDTSPSQWAVIESLVEEFGSGEGARDLHRTLFVVGDKKQSIYSFQGADARGFDTKRQSFSERLRPAGGLSSRELLYSFRSSPAILRAVDTVSSGTSLADGTGSLHRAYFSGLPGRVDLWPLVEPEDTPEEAPWFDPVDRIAPNHPAQRLAEGIAEWIRGLVTDPAAVIPTSDGGARRITEGDFLILVQGRTGTGGLFNRLIMACKARGLRVAGADRMKIRSELAVKDLLALLSFLALPEDDLSLAAALRSPLFGWSEQDLFTAAHGRGGRYLWQVLRERADHAETMAALDDLRRAADFSRPYEILERILGRHGGRAKLVARLGEEVEDGIDELLRQALDYERAAVPSLTGFLTWLEGEDLEVKRSSEGAGGQIQVMTVHGAKGLERPIVILPDTMRREERVRDEILPDATGVPLWRPGSEDVPDAMRVTLEDAKAAAREERDRLLYVAMTRAETWLVVAGAGEAAKRDGTWYGHVETALGEIGAAEIDGIRRFESDGWPEVATTAETEAPGAEVTLPDWVARAPVPAPEADEALSPSDLGGTKVLPDEAVEPGALDAALKRGRQIHLLLEHLPGVPAAERGARAVALLALGVDAASEEEAAGFAAEVGRILDAPALASVFGEGALAEVPFTARPAALGGRQVRGAIDRLVFAEDGLLAVDFKTNRIVPETPGEVPEGLLRQLGAYVAALSEIYPGRPVRPAILWTANATLMVLPNDIVMEALGRAATS
ncbi:double-strand break repair helicase AddA [Ovoidimarina sediminis]|uniref:double-strand break repair helicase AddA n=1 Tax=Ovoidimarina sediminis TaxID=3079856 RepID=UPI00290D76AE|nr:double-strand break repair helicase AddA [Rhodophyticola sp. MJ-SS7]MDU8942520.1 double-strand break repair helicase AddA [Rhodophyticola sp. MJ-SS7]